jgi:hypothetical protein
MLTSFVTLRGARCRETAIAGWRNQDVGVCGAAMPISLLSLQFDSVGTQLLVFFVFLFFLLL